MIVFIKENANKSLHAYTSVTLSVKTGQPLDVKFLHKDTKLRPIRPLPYFLLFVNGNRMNMRYMRKPFCGKKKSKKINRENYILSMASFTASICHIGVEVAPQMPTVKL